MQSEYFIFDGVKSIDMGIYLIRVSSGMIQSPFFGGLSIEEERAKNKIVPYHYGVSKEPIEFTILISPIEKEWTPQLRNKVGRWLIQDKYKPFQTGDDMGKIYYAICTEAPNFELAMNLGYLELTFRTNSPYAWTMPYIESFNLLNNNTTTIIEIENKSNVLSYFYPKMEISLLQLNGNATNTKQIKIKNLSDGGREFILGINNDLVGNEVIGIDNENGIIKTGNQIHNNVFTKFNRKWLRFVYGVNRLEVTGKCQLSIKNQFPILQ